MPNIFVFLIDFSGSFKYQQIEKEKSRFSCPEIIFAMFLPLRRREILDDASEPRITAESIFGCFSAALSEQKPRDFSLSPLSKTAKKIFVKKKTPSMSLECD